jgi:phospholipid-transporting ATPase
VRSADYSLSQFRFLLNLLLVHGRFGYIRVSKMICLYFYKNIVLVFTEIFFSFFSGFSGQLFFLDWLPTLYNAVFTSWSCLFAYMYERDINDIYALKYPIVYKIG